MSEQEDLKSEGERVPLSPGSASALLLPLQVAQQAQRNTNFFIDNILRPDFGCRKEPGLGLRDRAQSPERERVYPVCSVPGTPRLDSSCSNDSSSSSASSNASPSRSRSRRSSEGTAAGSDRREGPAESSSSSSVLKKRRGSPEDPSLLWPAWVYCTRYSDRPSSGPRTRKLKKSRSGKEDKRPRTAFTAEQLQRLKTEFTVNRYITEQRRQALAGELQLNESQIKIWFQNKRAKIKKASGLKNGLALQLMAQGLYNHSTTTVQDRDSD